MPAFTRAVFLFHSLDIWMMMGETQCHLFSAGALTDQRCVSQFLDELRVS